VAKRVEEQLDVALLDVANEGDEGDVVDHRAELSSKASSGENRVRRNVEARQCHC
jgi:hypothetical protein